MKKILFIFLGVFSFLLFASDANAILIEQQIRIGTTTYKLSDVILNYNNETTNLPEGVSWNNRNKTITLTNYTGGSIISVSNGLDLRINLEGTNTINDPSFYRYDIVGLYASCGDITINGQDNAVLNINMDTTTNARAIMISNPSNNNITINGGSVNINATTTADFVTGMYAPQVILNNNSNLSINVESTAKNVEHVSGIWSDLVANNNGDVKIVATKNAIVGTLTLNNKKNVYLFGKTDRSLSGSIEYDSELGASVASDYTLYGLADEPVLHAKYKDVIADTPITIKNIPLTAPVGAEVPQKYIETDQFYGNVSWGSELDYFDRNTIYTAQIKIIPKTGYTLDELTANFFNVEGATEVNYDEGIVTVVFLSSGQGTKTTINPTINIGSPDGGEITTPSIETTQYTASISWNPVDKSYETGAFLYNTLYEATVTITPKEGYTTIGIPANGYSIQGLSADDVTITNTKNSLTFKAVYKSVTTEGTNITIGAATYKISEDNPSSYASLPTGVTYDATNNRIVLENYTGEAVYNQYYYMPLSLYIKGTNTLTGRSVSTFYGEVLGLGAISAPIKIDGDINSKLNINISSNQSSRGIYISHYNTGNDITIDNTKVYINIKQTAGDVTTGIYGEKTTVKGKGRLNVYIDSLATEWKSGLNCYLNMQSTDSVEIKVVEKPNDYEVIALANGGNYNDLVETYNIYNLEGEFRLAYIVENNITLNSMTHGSAELNKTTASTGQQIELQNIEPDTDYAFQTVKIYDEYDNDVTEEVGYYAFGRSFIMPPYPVSVQVYFVSTAFSYDVTSIPTENGNFSLISRAYSGTTVQFSYITPDEFYRIKSVKILRASDDADITSLVNYNAITKEFTMPSYAIKAEIIFESDSYSITKIVPTHGSFTVPTTGINEKTITIETNPDDYYEVDSIKVYNAFNDEDISRYVSLNRITKTFTMPDYDVKVGVTYKLMQYPITAVHGTFGTINVIPRATYNANVSITNITPYQGYKLQEIKILKASDNSDVTEDVNYNSETHAFTMPGYEVKIIPLFTLNSVNEVPSLTVYTNTYNSLYLTWNKLENATGYRIYRASSKTGKYTYIKHIDNKDITSYVNTGLTSGKTYYYKIRGYNTTGEGPISTVRSNMVRPAKANLSALYTGYKSVKLSWNKIYGAYGYKIYRSTNGKTYSLVKTITSGSTLTYINSGLITNNKYYYKINAYRIVNKKNIYSYYSNVVSSTPYLRAPVVTGSSSYYKYARINFTKVTGADKYLVYRATSKDGTYSYIGKTASLYYLDYSAAEGVTYYYKVRGYRVVNKVTKYGTYSTAKIAKRASDVISYSLDSTQANNVVVTINRLDNAKYYYIYRSTARYGTYTFVKTISQNISSETYKYYDTGRTFNKLYYYKIKVSNINTSDYSVVKSKRTELGTPGLKTKIGGSFLESFLTIDPPASYASGYELYVSTEENGIYTFLTKTSYLTYKYELTREQYSANKTYYYKAKAYKIVDGKKYYGDMSEPTILVFE